MRAHSIAVPALLLLAGCNVEASSEAGDLDELEDRARDVARDASQLEICPGQTLEQLLAADSLSEQCRDALLSFLPQPESSFESGLYAPGGVREVDGELHVLLQGADDTGTALSAQALSEATVTLVWEDGDEVALLDGEFSIALAAELPADLLSVAVVNDYSASMFERDLVDVAEVERELFECVPKVHETQVMRFSETPQTVLDWSSDGEEIASALAHDDSFTRGTTALFDAVDAAAADLSTRERPVRVLILSTDGGENASTHVTQLEPLLDTLDRAGVFVVAFGALLADVDFMREVTDGRGVFFYTREFSGLQAAAGPYLESLKRLVELRIAAFDPPPAEVRVDVGELELTLAVESRQ